MPKLSMIREADEKNFAASVARLQGAAEIPDLIDRCMELLGRALEAQSGKHPVRRNTVLCFFLLVARRNVTTSYLALMRGHFPEAFRTFRTVIESVAFADRMLTRPDLVETWMRADEGNDSYKAFRRAFDTRTLRKETANDVVTKLLGQPYAICCKFTHPELEGFASGIRINVTPSGPEWSMDMSYYWVGKDKPHEPMMTFMWLTKHVGGVIAFFERWLLDDIKATNYTAWLETSERLKQEFEIWQAIWQPQVQLGLAVADDDT